MNFEECAGVADDFEGDILGAVKLTTPLQPIPANQNVTGARCDRSQRGNGHGFRQRFNDTVNLNRLSAIEHLLFEGGNLFVVKSNQIGVQVVSTVVLVLVTGEVIFRGCVSIIQPAWHIFEVDGQVEVQIVLRSFVRNVCVVGDRLRVTGAVAGEDDFTLDRVSAGLGLGEEVVIAVAVLTFANFDQLLTVLARLNQPVVDDKAIGTGKASTLSNIRTATASNRVNRIADRRHPVGSLGLGIKVTRAVLVSIQMNVLPTQQLTG